MGAGRRSWSVVAVLAGGGSRASSFVGDGEGRGWVSPLVRSGLAVVVVACVPSWAVRVVTVEPTRWGVCWLVTWLATSLSSLVVVVVSRWRWWWAVAAVGDGGDMAGLGCFGRWWWFVVVVAACGRLGSWAVPVCRCRWSLWAVVVVRRVGGRCRSSCVLVVVVRRRKAINKH